MTSDESTTGILNPYAEEARQRWGNTRAYQQSQERMKTMTKEEFTHIKDEADALLKKIAACAEACIDPADASVQALVQEHFDNLRHFYEPNLAMYRGLGSMYVDDPRFTEHYDAYRPGLAVYMRDAMWAYCDTKEAEQAA